MLIDTHCHLDAAEFDADRDAVHAAALAAGVERIVVPAVAVDGFPMTKTVVERYPGCIAASGFIRSTSPRRERLIWRCCANGWRRKSRWQSARSASMATSPTATRRARNFFSSNN